MKVKMTLSIGIGNVRQEETLELEDGLSEEDLDKAWQEWASNYIDGGVHVLDPDGDN